MSANGRTQDYNVDGILHFMRDYLQVRERQAVRLNPKVANVLDDVAWAQVENLKQVLQKAKGFGPERIRVADVLAGDDDLKKKALFSHSDQNSIVYEIINRADDQQRAVVKMAIHDMRTLFRSLDPSLENIVQLIQHWLLWDLFDSADMFHFEEQMRRCGILRSTVITEELRGRFRVALRKRPDERLTDEDILRFELKRLEATLQRFLTRRAEEEAYMMIIKADEAPYNKADREIIELAARLRTIEMVESGNTTLDASVLDHYVQALHCSAQEVTKERIVVYERDMIAESKMSLRKYLAEEHSTGEPYDYKKSQGRQLKERFAAEGERIEQHIRMVAASQAQSGAAPPHAAAANPALTPFPAV